MGNYGTDQLLVNDANGNFESVNGFPVVQDTDYPCCPIQTPYAAWVDYNNDMLLDLSVVHSSTDFIYKNNGTTLENSNALGEVNLLEVDPNFYWEDYDNDGDQDFLFLGTYDKPNTILENTGGGQLVVNTNTAFSVNHTDFHSVSWFDYDNDGFRDAIALGATHRVFKNLGNQNKWLKVRLVGSASNNKGVGAKIFLKSGGAWQRKDIITNHSYQIQQGFETIFGLRTSLMVDSIRIEWPAGSVQFLTSIPSNQIININELDAQIKPLYKPSNLYGKINDKSSILLTWKDNATDEEGVVIEQSSDGRTSFVDVATVTSNTQTFLVEGLEYGTTYFFRVVAIKGNIRSLPTNIYEGKIKTFQNTSLGNLTMAEFDGIGCVMGRLLG